jgi:hypothetical protein
MVRVSDTNNCESLFCVNAEALIRLTDPRCDRYARFVLFDHHHFVYDETLPIHWNAGCPPRMTSPLNKGTHFSAVDGSTTEELGPPSVRLFKPTIFFLFRNQTNGH